MSYWGLRLAKRTEITHNDKLDFMQLVLKKNLMERNLGSLQRLTRPEARLTVPKAYQAFMSSDDDIVIPVRSETPALAR